MAYYNGKKVLSVVQSGTQLYRHELEVLDQTNFDYYVTLISTDGTNLNGAQIFDIEKVVTAFYRGGGSSDDICVQALLRKKMELLQFTFRAKITIITTSIQLSMIMLLRFYKRGNKHETKSN